MRVAGGGKRGQAVHSEVIEMPSHGCRDELTYQALWVSGSSHAKTYGKAQCQGETFPITRLFGKVCARSNRHVKALNRVAPGEPCIVFGKVSDNTAVSV
jgi:hypothetical protein